MAPRSISGGGEGRTGADTDTQHAGTRVQDAQRTALDTRFTAQGIPAHSTQFTEHRSISAQYTIHDTPKKRNTNAQHPVLGARFPEHRTQIIGHDTRTQLITATHRRKRRKKGSL